MTKKRKLFKFLILASIVFTSCVSTKTFLKHDQIPGDFGKGNKTVLIIPSFDDVVNRAAEDAFEKYYKGSYEISGGSKKSKKSEASIGYTFHTYIENNGGSFTAVGRQAPSTDYYYGVTDLQTKKTHKMLRFGNYKNLAKHYVQALETVRKKNE